ncbi:MAG: twin-arginine translocation signal domain-containing protein, partial [Bacteroidota bacterium]
MIGSKKEKTSITRRRFLGTSALAVAGLTILPSSVMGGMGK